MRVWAVLAIGSVVAHLVLAQLGPVKRDRMDSTVKVESVVAGHLSALNGKYKLRASETVYQPAGMIGEFQHAGPGIRYVKSGTLR